MIHQLIFANLKPGMAVKEFQDYWIHIHAVKYASKIPQIKKYKVNRVLHYMDVLGGNHWVTQKILRMMGK